MNTNNNIVTKENNKIERYYTLEQAKEILRNERINKMKMLKEKAKQKAFGLFLIALKESGIENFLEEYATIEEVPEGVSVQKVELCLTIYTQHDFKLEACCTDTNNEQYWVEINEQFTNADEFIQMIPNYEKIKL